MNGLYKRENSRISIHCHSKRLQHASENLGCDKKYSKKT
ncbi:hypothetical protein RSAG8_06838, partial [Rhizoctonia solani AG-8 WAC10335]